nr:hypothetical protein [Myxococcota bacterium]
MIWLYVGMVGFALAMLRGGAAIARASRERGFTRPVKQMTLALVLGAASLLLTPVLAAMEPSPVQKGLWVASDVLMRIAICALLLFVSETFGWLESRISVAWLVAVGLLLFATLAYDAASQPSLAYDPSTAGAMLSQLPIAAAFATVSGITLREWVRSRRRERLG